MNSSQRLRARFILIVILLSSLVLASSLYWTQLVQGEVYAAKANQQYEKPASALFYRGSIYFMAKDGTKVAAATVARGYLVSMDPTKLTDPEGAYQALSHYLGVDKDMFMKQAAKTADRYEEIADHVDEEIAIAIGELGLAGINLTKQNWRSYPGKKLAAHVMGLIGERKDTGIEGRYGLERTYENVLRRPGVGSSANVFAQIFTGLRDSVFGDNGWQQGELVTTIEPTVESFVEDVLKKTQAEWNPDRIGAIVMDPNTGEIVALAALPSFDPGDLSEVTDVSVFSNPLVEHVYEMGSIMKPLTMAIGLDSGAVTLSSTYNDTGTMTLDDRTISNYDGKARGITPMQEILSQSLNIGVATIALKVGKEKFISYLNTFALAEKTNIDQPNEATGLLDNLKSALDVEVATAAYGQGIAVSPITMTRALATLANGGYLVRPHLVKKIEHVDGTTEDVVVEKSGPVLDKKTTEDVTEMLVKVVDTALKGGKIKMEHYSIAAKTGTAQVPDPIGGGYYKDRYLHSFVGYFPAYDPKFIIFLYQMYPKGAQFASETLTTPFEDIAKFLITYYEVPPDR